MPGMKTGIYESIAKRTNGDIYIGVVGPVRVGKSTFVKRLMETLVIPNIENIYLRERAKDELPQSGSGKMIMTSEPKFIPEEAVTISPDGKTTLSIRMIDSVGYMIPGAVGAEENGRPRMVTTPWLPTEIPMEEAAELGTKKVMEEHCSVGIVVTTDGSITDIPRDEYLAAEQKAIRDMQSTGKPFIVLVNSSDPQNISAQKIRDAIETEYGVPACCVNCLEMGEEELANILQQLLTAFPVEETHIYLPSWLQVLEADHPLKMQLYGAIRKAAEKAKQLNQLESSFWELNKLEFVENTSISEIDAGSGIGFLEIWIPETYFYGILSEQSGFQIENDADLLRLLKELSVTKQEHDKISAALEQVRATGYGIVMPTPDEMRLEKPQIVRKGGNYGVKLKASAPSIHMLRADIEAEINPMVGDEKQSEDLLQYLLKEYEDDTEKLWSSNIFGKSVYDLVSDGLGAKLHKMPEQSRYKLQTTLSRIINEGSSGLICIILS